MPQVPGNVQQSDILVEDRREAAILQASLSNYVATAALAVLVGVAGIFTYVSQTFDPSFIFYILIASTALSLVVSIFIGGKGTDVVVEQIATRSWTPNERNGRYAAQATLTLLGLVLLLISTAVGVTAPRQQSTLEGRVDRLAREVASLTVATDKQQPGSERLWLEHLIATSDYRIDKLEVQFQHTPSQDSRAAVADHLVRQRGVQRRQCHALAALIHEIGEDEAVALCTNLPHAE